MQVFFFCYPPDVFSVVGEEVCVAVGPLDGGADAVGQVPVVGVLGVVGGHGRLAGGVELPVLGALNCTWSVLPSNSQGFFKTTNGTNTPIYECKMHF